MEQAAPGRSRPARWRASRPWRRGVRTESAAPADRDACDGNSSCHNRVLFEQRLTSELQLLPHRVVPSGGVKLRVAHTEPRFERRLISDGGSVEGSACVQGDDCLGGIVGHVSLLMIQQRRVRVSSSWRDKALPGARRGESVERPSGRRPCVWSATAPLIDGQGSRPLGGMMTAWAMDLTPRSTARMLLRSAVEILSDAAAMRDAVGKLIAEVDGLSGIHDWHSMVSFDFQISGFA